MKNTDATSAAPARLRRRLASALLVFSVFVGTMATTATPASAASYVFGCFRMADGSGFAGLPVQLEARIYGVWTPVAYQTLGANSCIGWPIPAELSAYRWRIAVNTWYANAKWFGTSRLEALPGNLVAHLGTSPITCIGCAY